MKMEEGKSVHEFIQGVKKVVTQLARVNEVIKIP
jgi:hypothetical protein